jgi:hypothetical protein
MFQSTYFKVSSDPSIKAFNPSGLPVQCQTGSVGPTGPAGASSSSVFWAGKVNAITGSSNDFVISPQTSANSNLFSISSSTQVSIPTGAMYFNVTFNCTIDGQSLGSVTMTDSSSSNPVGDTASTSIFNSSTGPRSFPLTFSAIKKYVNPDTIKISSSGISSVNGLLMIQKLS